MTEIVAEISGNHGGSLAYAFKLITLAKEAGADAVKFQCFSPERQAVKRNRPDVLDLVQREHGGKPLLDLYREVHTPWDWFPQLIAWCHHEDIAWFSSAFDPLDVDFLESLDCPRYKISAFEMLDWRLIKRIEETGKPIVYSVRSTGKVTVLHASNYDGTFNPMGISAHGPIASFVLGHMTVPMIEWHLKLPDVETQDSAFSLTPDELQRAIAATRAGALPASPCTPQVPHLAQVVPSGERKADNHRNEKNK
jgi:sialic acid synthase SpsE